MTHQNPSRVFAPYVYFECKNYGKDIDNPSLEQLTGRFSQFRGNLGFLVCRTVKDEITLLKRCKGVLNDNRGAVLILTDQDLITMLNNIKNGCRLNNEKILTHKYKRLIG